MQDIRLQHRVDSQPTTASSTSTTVTYDLGLYTPWSPTPSITTSFAVSVTTVTTITITDSASHPISTLTSTGPVHSFPTGSSTAEEQSSTLSATATSTVAAASKATNTHQGKLAGIIAGSIAGAVMLGMGVAVLIWKRRKRHPLA